MTTEHSISLCKNENGRFMVLRNDMFVGEVLRQGKVWEQHIVDIIRSVIDPSCTAINVGAHIGSHAIPMARGSHSLIAIEPQPTIHWLLSHNLFENGLHNKSTTYNMACGHVSGINVTMAESEPWSTAKVDYSTNKFVNYGAVAIGKGSVTVPMTRVDDLKIPKPVSLILVDVEGCEPLVFWGAKETIKKYRPTLIFERNQCTITSEIRKICGDPPDEIVNFKIEDFVKDLNYNKLFVHGDDRVLIPMPEKTASISEKYVGGWTYDGQTFKHPNRQDASIAWTGEDALIVYFPDYDHIFTCEIMSDQMIIWSNGDMWVPEY